MSPEIEAALITATVTVLAGGAGYLFREYRNRAKPFTAVTKVGGNFRKGSSVIDVPEPLLDSLAGAFAINKLDSRDTLDEIYSSWKDARRVTDSGGDFIGTLTKIVDAAHREDREDVLRLLPKALGRGQYEKWVTLLLAKDAIDIPDRRAGLDVEIPTWESDEHGGCVWIGFPGGTATTFGMGFESTPILRDKCLPVVELIEHLDYDGLASVFEQVETLMSDELTIAKDTFPLLDDILNEQSRWEVQLYVANLGRNPFLVKKNAVVRVEDETGASYTEGCHLVLLNTDDDGSLTRTISDSPLVLGAEEDAKFAFFTNRVQRQMDRGGAFREAFESDEAQCSVKFSVEKAGFRRETSVETPWVPFTDA